MASVERRERNSASGERQLRYIVRWREPDGRTRAKSFPRKVEASRFAATISADIVRGQYFDPDAGKMTFKDYATNWLAAQTFDEGTSEAVALRLRLHAYPGIGPKFLSDIKPSTIQTWLRGLSELAPTYQKVLFANVSTVLTAAVDDSLIQKNPCKAPSVRKPRSEPRKMTPWSPEQVRHVGDALPDRYALVAQLGAGLGLRQGEILGLSLDDIDIEKGEVEIVRQVKLRANNKARYDRFLFRVFADGEESEWLLKGGLSMLARVPRSRTTKDVDLAAQHATDLDEAERALSALVAVDLGDHLTFRLIRSIPTGLDDNQPGVETRRFAYACLDADHGTHIDTVSVDVVVGPGPIGAPEVVEPANRLHLRRPLVTQDCSGPCLARPAGSTLTCGRGAGEGVLRPTNPRRPVRTDHQPQSPRFILRSRRCSRRPR